MTQQLQRLRMVNTVNTTVNTGEGMATHDEVPEGVETSTLVLRQDPTYALGMLETLKEQAEASEGPDGFKLYLEALSDEKLIELQVNMELLSAIGSTAA